MTERPPENLTAVLSAIERGQSPSEQLLPLVYDELRTLAASRMRHEKSDHTLQPTALVHEALMRLVGDQWNGAETDAADSPWRGRRYFFAAAAEAMRRILVESARRRNADKRGGGWTRCDLGDEPCDVRVDDEEILSLHEALLSLQQHDEQLAKLVELRYFAGLTVDQTGEILDMSPRSVKRHWAYARAWLRDRIDKIDNGTEP